MISVAALCAQGCAAGSGAVRPDETTSLVAPAFEPPVITFSVAGTSRVQTAQPFLMKVAPDAQPKVGKESVGDGAVGLRAASDLKIASVERPPAFGQYLIIDVDFTASGNTSTVMRSESCSLSSGDSREILYLWGDMEGAKGFAGTHNRDGLSFAGFEIPAGGTVRKRFIVDWAPSAATAPQLACTSGHSVTIVP